MLRVYVFCICHEPDCALERQHNCNANSLILGISVSRDAGERLARIPLLTLPWHENYVSTLVLLVASPQLRWQRGLETKPPYWNGPNHSPYWGSLLEICKGSSPVCQMDDQAGPGSAAASFDSWCRGTRGRMWIRPHRKKKGHMDPQVYTDDWVITQIYLTIG